MPESSLEVAVDVSQPVQSLEKLAKNLNNLTKTIESTMKKVDKVQKSFDNIIPKKTIQSIERTTKTLAEVGTALTKTNSKIQSHSKSVSMLAKNLNTVSNLSREFSKHLKSMVPTSTIKSIDNATRSIKNLGISMLSIQKMTKAHIAIVMQLSAIWTNASKKVELFIVSLSKLLGVIIGLSKSFEQMMNQMNRIFKAWQVLIRKSKELIAAFRGLESLSKVLDNISRHTKSLNQAFSTLIPKQLITQINNLSKGIKRLEPAFKNSAKAVNTLSAALTSMAGKWDIAHAKVSKFVRSLKGFNRLITTVNAISKRSGQIGKNLSSLFPDKAVADLANVQASLLGIRGAFASMKVEAGKLLRPLTRILLLLKRIVKEVKGLTVSFKKMSGSLAATGAATATLNRLSQQTEQSRHEATYAAVAQEMLRTVLTKMGNAALIAGRRLMGLGRSLFRSRRIVDQTTSQVRQLNTQFQQGSIVGRAFSNVITLIGVSLSGLSLHGLGALSDQYKEIKNRTRLVLTETKALSGTMTELYEISKRTRSGLFDIGTLYSRLARNSKELGLETSQLLQITENVGRAMIISGASAMEARNAIIQLSQAFASGKLQGDELRSVLELAPRLARAIASGMKVSVGSLRALSKQGILDVKMVAKAILFATRKLQIEYSKIDVTFGQAFEVLRNSFMRMIGITDEETGATTRLTSAIIKMAKAVENFGSSRWMQALINAFDWLAKNSMTWDTQ